MLRRRLRLHFDRFRLLGELDVLLGRLQCFRLSQSRIRCAAFETADGSDGSTPSAPREPSVPGFAASADPAAASCPGVGGRFRFLGLRVMLRTLGLQLRRRPSRLFASARPIAAFRLRRFASVARQPWARPPAGVHVAAASTLGGCGARLRTIAARPAFGSRAPEGALLGRCPISAPALLLAVPRPSGVTAVPSARAAPRGRGGARATPRSSGRSGCRDRRGPGLAKAGATPPVERAHRDDDPDASTATTLRREQVSKGGTHLGIDSSGLQRVALNRHRCFAAISPDTGNGPAGAAVLLGWPNDACGGATIRFQQLIARLRMCYSRRISPHLNRWSVDMETRDRLFIGNEWVAPATDRTHRCHLAHHRRGVRTHARWISGRHRPRGRRRA